MIFYERGEWLRNRLQYMGPAEIASRLVDVGRHLALSASLKGIQRRARKKTGTSEPLPVAQFFKPRLDRIPISARAAVIAAADGWLNHRATFFSLCDVPLGDAIDWHRDYSSGAIASVKYSGFINHRDMKDIGNVKYIWELNRLQHLTLLAMALVWTGDEAYNREIEQQVLSWQVQNPFMKGLNWKSPLEAAVRLISWAYVFFVTSALVDRGKKIYWDNLRETIYLHQYFIRTFYSKNSSANNHLIGEMAGLYVGSVFWPWYSESASWRSFSRQKLIEEIDRQVETDGVGRERATEYQMFIFELFLLAGALGQVIGDPFPRKYWDRVNRMAAFLLAISNRVGDFPMFGDGDSGQVIALPETRTKRFCALAQIGEFREGAASPDLRSHLLLWGQTSKEVPLGPVRSSDRSLQVFPDGGYYVLTTDRGGENEIVIVFDAGPLGLPPLNAHGHADALSFWLSYGGEEFLIDPGTYCYDRFPVWRSYFRGTSAHNTVRIDGQDQSTPGGTFLWRQEAHCRIEHINKRDDFVDVAGSHDGYRRLPDPVIHTRKLQLFKKSRTLVITDRLECEGPHDIELFFHFSEICQLRQVGPGSFEALNRNKRISMRVDSRLKPELYRGCENPILGWVSRTFGVKKPSFTLVARARIMGSSQFLTEISAI